MKLFEFDKGTEVRLCSEKGHKKHEFSTSILYRYPEHDRVILAPIIIDGRLVRFSKPDITHTIAINVKSKAYEFPDVKITEMHMTTSDKHKYVLCAECDADVEAVNRRNFFRVYLGVKGTMLADVSYRTHEVIVKDISANGLGVICPKDFRFPIGTEVQVTFVDELTDESFELECTIVRRVKHDDSSIVYGCQLPEVSDSMQKFVALKQRITKNMEGQFSK